MVVARVWRAGAAAYRVVRVGAAVYRAVRAGAGPAGAVPLWPGVRAARGCRVARVLVPLRLLALAVMLAPRATGLRRTGARRCAAALSGLR
ncbi:hypothetical protein [Streptomyces sp. NPDC018031]|uniref:hypothetical protein n=1 Tax=Streptomyces sp. NPDC018031 TaxID=3365033 RepID=UPI003788032A